MARVPSGEASSTIISSQSRLLLRGGEDVSVGIDFIWDEEE